MPVLALEWQERYGVAPHITSAISEYDAAMLVGMSDEQYSSSMSNRTAVAHGHDFEFMGVRYQVKANRPSGRRGSFVTLVGKANNLDWDALIWILYDKYYALVEAWMWGREEYAGKIMPLKRLSPIHMREGSLLFRRS